MPIFSNLCKIYKNRTKPPVRPIIAGINSLTSSLLQHIDRHLQKFVVILEFYWMDTKSLKLTQITDGHARCVVTLFKHTAKLLDGVPLMPTKQKKIILDSINFILKHIVFSFHDDL